MKNLKKYLLLGFCIVFLIILVVVINNNRIVRSIKSEHQLLEIYNNHNDRDFSIIERILTLPFSLGTTHRYKGMVDIDYMAVEDASMNDGEVRDYSKTNIQVEGVDEADIIKTDGYYIYSISNNNVIITNVKDEKNIFIESKINGSSSIPNDLLLYKNYLVVFSYKNESGRWDNQNTLVEVYNVKDAKNEVTQKVKNDGPY